MAKNIYRSAQGKIVDLDVLRLANEKTIAVGNMRTNARGDQLGPGGEILKTRAQLMQEYYALNTNVATDDTDFGPEPEEYEAVPVPKSAPLVVDSVKEELLADEVPAATPAPKKTSLADQVADDLANKTVKRI